MSHIYLDYNSTTPIDNDVADNLASIANFWGNTSSIHTQSRKPKQILREARKNITKLIGATTPLEIVFTSGGSESNNQVIKGVFFNNLINNTGRDHYLCGITEHPSTIEAFEFIKKLGAKVEFIPEDKLGSIDMEKYDRMISNNTAMVCKMLVNSETGIVYPIKKMVKCALKKNVLFFSDCVQGLGKMPLSVTDLGLDFATFASHKCYALKGCGVTYIKTGLNIEPLVHGGGQERSRRSGTENILAIHSMSEVLKKDFSKLITHMKNLRDHFEENINLDGIKIVGKDGMRVCNTSNIIIDGIDNETVLINLDVMGFAVSAGTACSSGRGEPSPVLTNMGYSSSEATRSIRISFGWNTTLEEVDKFSKALRDAVKRVRRAYTIANQQ